MGTKWAEVTLHIDEETTHDQRENFRDRFWHGWSDYRVMS